MKDYHWVVGDRETSLTQKEGCNKKVVVTKCLQNKADTLPTKNAS